MPFKKRLFICIGLLFLTACEPSGPVLSSDDKISDDNDIDTPASSVWGTMTWGEDNWQSSETDLSDQPI